MLKILLLCSVFFILNVNANDEPYIPSVLPSKNEVLRIKENDIVIGCENAKNTIIEYSSLGCPHCAEYYKTVFPRIKSEIINTCKAKYVYRDFPMTKSALKASGMLHCVIKDDDNKEKNDHFMRLVQTLFNSQASWAFTPQYEENISKILSIIGIPQNRISQCVFDKAILNDIISNSFISTKVLNIAHSPSIFINGIEVQPLTFDSVSAAIK